MRPGERVYIRECKAVETIILCASRLKEKGEREKQTRMRSCGKETDPCGDDDEGR